MKKPRCFFAKMAALLALAPCAASAQRPVSTTAGALVEPPALCTNHFDVPGTLEAVEVPLEGWKVAWPVRDADAESPCAGIRVVETNDVVRGARLPVLRLELTHGSFKGAQPVVELARPFNAETHNVLSFVAKVEVPPTLKRVIGDSPEVDTGWFSSAFNRYFDDFGVAPDDGNFQWAAYGVPTTMFRYHDFPETRGPDGYADFAWDMRDDHYTGNKGFVRDRALALRLHYDTRKIPEGEKVVVSIAQMKLVRGAHARVDDPVRYAAWTNFVASYKPDFSDSAEYLLPPKTGRIEKPIRIVENGRARCEIVVDVSDAIRVENFFPNRDKWLIYLREERGKEKAQARYAAGELRRWLREVTGADVPVLLEPSGERNVKIYLGATFAKPHFPQDLALLASGGAHDGYAIRALGGDLYIFGASPAGTIYGVCAFLENNTDLIWAFRDGEEDGTVFTPTPTLDIVWADVVSKPAMAWRGVWAGEWGLHNSMNVNSTLGWAPYGGHYLSPQYYNASEGMQRFNPVLDRFAGGREKVWSEYRSLSCLADPAFIEHSTEFVPNVKLLRYNGREHCVFGVDDNYGVCECPLCTAPITNKAGRVLAPDTDYRAYYNAWFYTYLNKLDARIQEVSPGFMTSTFAYFFAAPYPEIELSRNIQPQLCTYVRKSQAEPLFSPVNQHWWRIYRDWAAHGASMVDYDYWALGFLMYPKAEAAKFDAMAKRDIGSLSFYSEGDCAGEYLSTANQRWCIARLLWNPDLDVEQLHRAFNRRVYREAAPWMDRFGGVFREAFFHHANRHIDFEENREAAVTIRDLGIEQELRGYLAKALEAAKSPRTRRLVEKTIADFDYYMVPDKSDWNYPSKRWAEFNEGKADPLAAAAASVWSANRDVRTADGVRELPLLLSRDRGFEVKFNLGRPGEADLDLTFRVPRGAFSLDGPPAVESVAEGGARTARAHGWRDLGNGAWVCTVRVAGAPAGQTLSFAYPKEGPRWLGSAPLALVGAQLRDVSGAAPAPEAPAHRKSPGWQRLADAMATNDAPGLAALAASPAAPAAVRVLAAGEASRRGRRLADLLQPMLGKMDGLGFLWGAQLLEPAKALMAAGDYVGAAAFLCEHLALCETGGDPARDCEPLRLLAKCAAAAEGPAAVERLLAERLAGLGADPAAAFRVRRSILPVLAGLLDANRAADLLDQACADGRVEPKFLVPFAQDFVRLLAADPKATLPADRALALLRRHDGDERGKAIGWSLAARDWGRAIDGIARAYAGKGDFASVSALYGGWACVDGDRTPVDYAAERLGAGVGFLRDQAKALAGDTRRLEALAASSQSDASRDLTVARSDLGRLEAQLEKDVARWRDVLALCAKEGSTPDVRFGAQYAILQETWDATPPADRAAKIDEWVADAFLTDDARRKAASLVVPLYVTPSSTNWTALADHAVRCVAAGDWSCNAYRANRATDKRLDYLLELADRLVAAGREDVAKSLLERGAAAIGLVAASDKPDAEGRPPEGWLLERVKRLDEKMALCGASRQ